jgi:periplasmic divalent cation tolerance protein
MSNKPPQLLAVFTTVADEGVAQDIASALVGRGLVACAQISRIDSIYRWKDTVQNNSEFRLMLKTTAARYEAVEAAILELHPYELPAVFAVEVCRASSAYAAWVVQGNSAGTAGIPGDG